MPASPGPASSYALLDAGDGRRLERFGGRVVDRPAPVAGWPRRRPSAWAGADLRFERATGWEERSAPAEPWELAVGGLVVELRPTPTGQVGLFPEQLVTWHWIARQVAERMPTGSVRVLNLFGYTGGATLTAARAGAEVVHVDASRPTLAWGRENARRSGLGTHPIRWIPDDALAFVRREDRRRRRYDGLVLDPPSYGHGGTEAWRFERDLPDLLAACGSVLAARPFVALTAHTPGFGPSELAAILADGLRLERGDVEAAELSLTADSGVVLPLGASARWSP